MFTIHRYSEMEETLQSKVISIIGSGILAYHHQIITRTVKMVCRIFSIIRGKHKIYYTLSYKKCCRHHITTAPPPLASPSPSLPPWQISQPNDKRMLGDGRNDKHIPSQQFPRATCVRTRMPCSSGLRFEYTRAASCMQKKVRKVKGDDRGWQCTQPRNASKGFITSS